MHATVKLPKPKVKKVSAGVRVGKAYSTHKNFKF